ncbi:MAG TPA: flagellar basal-body MS-ring/collar protein FliF [Stellaceae bacterium]|nr:flagellar basal-body MS-ring/collar protein FliF [Stellaceae bacterium]
MAFLDALNPQTLWERARPVLGGQARAVVVVGGAAALAIVAVASLWLWSSDYAVLYAGLAGEEGGRAIAELQKLNIPYRITEGGRVIQVPAADVGRARLQLAARGVAKRDGDEWAILDNQSIGVSPFVEQVHYVRGVEAALSRTVGEIDGVVSAKVTLAIPKDTGFLGDSAKPSGSVLVRLRPGFALSGAQVNGIVGLVASSVPGLSREQVTVVDQSGAVLNAAGKDALQAPQQLEITREVNRRYEAMVTDLLSPVLGRGNFRISSDADIDFSQTKESLVKYGDSHVLSQDETIHARGAGGDQPIGIPGALSNRRPDTPSTNATPPPPPAQAAQAAAPGQPATPTPPAAAEAATPSDTHRTTNYDIDKTVQYLEHPSWMLRGVSIAVLVNNPTGKPLAAERLQSINKLVGSAIGAGQNPHVTVVDLPFEAADGAVVEPAGPWWREPWMAAVARNAMLALAGLLALFGGLFPLLNRLAGAQAALAVAPPAAAVALSAGAGGDSRSAGGAQRPNSQPQDVFSIEADTVQTLVTHDPARTAQVIRGWIAGDRGTLK